MNVKQARAFIASFLGLEASLVRTSHRGRIANHNALFATPDDESVSLDKVYQHAQIAFGDAASIWIQPGNRSVRRDLDIRFGGHQIVITKYSGVKSLHIEMIDKKAKRSVVYFERGLGLPLSPHSIIR